MAGPFTETFTASDGTDVSSLTGWTKYSGQTSPKIYSNRVYGLDGTGARFAYYNTAVASAHYAKVKLTDNTVGTDSGGVGPAIRIQSGANSGFSSFIDGSANTYNGQTIGGSTTDWDSGVANVTLNSVYELAADPVTTTTIYARKDGKTYAVYTGKSGLSGGYAGVTAWDGGPDGYGVDDWEGGDVTQGWFQQKQSSAPSGSSAGSVAVTYDSAVQSGSLLVAFVCWSTGTDEALSSFSDSVNGAWTAGPSVHDSTNGEKLALYYKKNSASGTPTVTATFVANRGWNGLWIAELRGMDTTTQPDVSGTGQVQAGPGTTADAISSGATSGTATANAYCIGVSIDSSDAGTISAGTAKVPGLGWDGEALPSKVEAWFEGAASSTATATFTDATNGGSHRYLTAVLPFRPGTGAVYQYQRPSSDHTDGSWTPSTGSDNYAVMDETPRSDTDYSYVNSDSTLRVNLAAPTYTVASGTRTLNYAISGGPEKKMLVRLVEGTSTVVQTFTHDPAPTSLTEYNQTVTGSVSNYSDLDVEVEVAAATTPVSGTVTYGAAGTASNSATGPTPSYPTGISASTSELFCIVCSGASGDPTPTMPAGWTQQVTANGGVGGTYGLDAGNRRVTLFKKDTVTGSETGNVTVTISGGNTGRARIFRVEKPSGYTVSVATTSGTDSSSGTGYSAAGSSVTWRSGQLLIVGTALVTDSTTQSSRAISASGVTFGTLTNVEATAVTTGSDHRFILDYATVGTSNTSSAPTYSHTDSASNSGATAYMVISAYPTEKGRITWLELKTPYTASTPMTLTATLNAAVQAAITSTSTLNAAVQGSPTPLTATLNAGIADPKALTATVDLAVANAQSATATLNAALQAAVTSAATLDAGIQAGQSATSTLSAAVVLARQAQAALDAAVQSPSSATVELNAAIQAARTAAATLEAAIQSSGASTATADAAIAASRDVVTALDAAIQAARSGTSTMDAAIQAQAAATATLDLAVQVGRSATASLDASIEEGAVTFTSTTTLDAAIQIARTTTATLDGAIQAAMTASATLEAAIQQVNTAQSTISAAVQGQASDSATLDAALSQSATTQGTVSAAIQGTGSASADIGAAIQAPASGTATLDGAIQAPTSIVTTLDGAIQAAKTAAATLDTYVLSGGQALANLDAAISAAESASASLDGAIQVSRASTVSADAAIESARWTTMSADSVIQAARDVAASLDMAVQGQASIFSTLDANIISPWATTAAMDAAILWTGSATAFMDVYIAVLGELHGGGGRRRYRKGASEEDVRKAWELLELRREPFQEIPKPETQPEKVREGRKKAPARTPGAKAARSGTALPDRQAPAAPATPAATPDVEQARGGGMSTITLTAFMLAEAMTDDDD